MTTFTETESRPQDLIIRGLPDAAKSLRLADILSKIKAEAEKRGHRLERLELTHVTEAESEACVYYAVADFPQDLRFESMEDARMAIEAQIFVEPWEEKPASHPRSKRRALERLLKRVAEANERDAFNARDGSECDGGFAFPAEPLGCVVRVVGVHSRTTPYDEELAAIDEMGKRLGCSLSLVWVDHEDVVDTSDVPAYLALVPSDISHRLNLTDEAMAWLSGMIRARTSLLPTDATTLRALESVREQAERRLAEGGG